MNKYSLEIKLSNLRLISNNNYINQNKYNLSDKILIIDTYYGLCNQILDIHLIINYCLKNNIKFSFRYASFRNPDLISYYNVNFNELFDESFLDDIDLYIDYKTLNLTPENTFNYDGKLLMHNMLKNDMRFLSTIKEMYIVLRGITLFLYEKIECPINIYSRIKPCNKILTIYKNINSKLIKEPYNFLHYRYESDFVNGHNINNIPKLDKLITTITFKKNNKIYLASTNIRQLLMYIDNSIFIFKDENELKELNYEERAFIDFMFGKHADEVYGHPRSSFSIILNSLKDTKNYY